MLLILKNDKGLLKEKYRFLNLFNKEELLKDSETESNLDKQSPSFYSLINTINTNSILNPPSENKLIINFEDFTIFNKFILNQKNYFKTKINKLFKTDLNVSDDYAFYNKDDKVIHIREQLFTQTIDRQYLPTFSQVLKNSVSSSDFLNFAVLHEIGHAIHHQYFIKISHHLSSQSTMSDFINKTVSFYGYIDLVGNVAQKHTFRNKEISIMNFHALNEGFADLYACIAIGEIYPKNEAVNLIENIIKARQEADKGYEFYCSYPSIEQYLNDLKNDTILFKDFNSMHKYMSSTIENTIQDILHNQMLKKDNLEIQLNNRYVGLMNKQLHLNQLDTTSTILKLNKQYGLNLSLISSLEQDFKGGEIIYEKNKNNLYPDKNKKIVQSKIQELRHIFSSKKNDNSNSL